MSRHESAMMRRLREKKSQPRMKPGAAAITTMGIMLDLQTHLANDRAILRSAENMNRTFDRGALDDLARNYWLFFDQLKLHDASEIAWNNVTCSLNVAMLLCERGFGEEHLPLLIRALEGMFKAKQRGERTGRYRLDGDGLRAVKEALEVHDAQMLHVTPRDMIWADQELKKRMAEGNVYTAEAIH